MKGFMYALQREHRMGPISEWVPQMGEEGQKVEPSELKACPIMWRSPVQGI